MEPKITSNPKERNVGLDLLRALAVLLVLGHHLPAMPSLTSESGAFGLLIDIWRRGGWVGVDLFFVLSGFLIGGLLFEEYRKNKAVSISRFYLRRGWKIYPPFFFLIFVTVIIQGIVHHKFDVPALLAECMFIQNYAPGMWNHTWSLAVEEHFYILLPLLLVGLMKLNRNAEDPFAWVLPIGVLVCGVVILGLRMEQQVRIPNFHHHTHMAPTHLRLDSLLCGVLLAYVHHFHRERFMAIVQPHRGMLTLIGCGLLAIPFIHERAGNPFVYTIGPTIYGIGAAALICGVSCTTMPRSATVWWFSRIGVYSYSIYLWHMPVMRWGAPKMESMLGATLSAPLLVAIHLSFSVIVGIIMAKTIEGPAMRLRDYWYPSPSGTLQPPNETIEVVAPSQGAVGAQRS